MEPLISVEEFRQAAEVFCAAQLDEQIANEADPEARRFLQRNRQQIVARYVELSCAHHAGRLLAEREAAAARRPPRDGLH